MKKIVFIVALCFTLGANTNTYAQDESLNELLSEIGPIYAKSYLQPMVDALGANLNSGLFNTAQVGGGELFGLNVSLGIRASAVPIIDRWKTFDLTYRGELTTTVSIDGSNTEQTVIVPITFNVTDAPTVFGDDVAPFATGVADTTILVEILGVLRQFHINESESIETIPGSGITENLNIIPFALPQLTVGTVLGTEFSVRWLPKIAIPDIGSLNVLGYGLKHSLNQYITVLPFKLAGQAMWQSISVDDSDNDQILDIQAFAANIQASKRFGFITLYAGWQTEKTLLNVDYTLVLKNDEGAVSENVPISFELESASRQRVLAGLTLHLGPLQIHGDYSIGNINSFSTGLGLSF